MPQRCVDCDDALVDVAGAKAIGMATGMVYLRGRDVVHCCASDGDRDVALARSEPPVVPLPPSGLGDTGD